MTISRKQAKMMSVYKMLYKSDHFILSCYVVIFSILIYHMWKKLTSCLEIKPIHVYQETSDFARHILEKSKNLSKPYKPQLWMSNRHLQTLLPCFMGLVVPEVKYDREYLTMDDGEQIAADWVVSDLQGKQLKDIVVLLPGITGDIRGYSTLCRMCVKQNFRTVIISKRGYGGSKLKLPKLTGFGDGSDLHCALKIIRKR